MPERKRNPYARTYLIAANGSAALKVQEMMDVTKRENSNTKKKPLMLVAPCWGLLLAAAVCVFLFALMLLSMSSDASKIHKEILNLRLEEGRAREIMGSLEVQILQAEAPEIIHSLAVNRLNMRRPTENEIVYIPYVGSFIQAGPVESSAQEQASLWRYLIGLLGF